MPGFHVVAGACAMENDSTDVHSSISTGYRKSLMSKRMTRREGAIDESEDAPISDAAMSLALAVISEATSISTEPAMTPTPEAPIPTEPAMTPTAEAPISTEPAMTPTAEAPISTEPAMTPTAMDTCSPSSSP